MTAIFTVKCLTVKLSSVLMFISEKLFNYRHRSNIQLEGKSNHRDDYIIVGKTRWN